MARVVLFCARRVLRRAAPRWRFVASGAPGGRTGGTRQARLTPASQPTQMQAIQPRTTLSFRRSASIARPQSRARVAVRADAMPPPPRPEAVQRFNGTWKRDDSPGSLDAEVPPPPPSASQPPPPPPLPCVAPSSSSIPVPNAGQGVCVLRTRARPRLPHAAHQVSAHRGGQSPLRAWHPPAACLRRCERGTGAPPPSAAPPPPPAACAA